MKNVLKKLKRQPDHLILSFPKSGRTWLRMMLNKIIVDEFHIADANLINTQNLTKKIASIPTIHFSHDDDPHLKRVEEISSNKKAYKNKKIVLLVRDPRDTIVSYYFQYTKRENRKAANDDFDGSMSEFIHHPIGSIDSMITFFNIWVKQRVVPSAFFLIRYEDLMDDPVYQMQRLLDFLKIPAKLETIQNAVEYCKFENMKKMEKSGTLGGRLKPTDASDPESFKVRKGKIGGYVDYLSPEDITYIDQKLETELDDYYYYYKTK